LLMNGSSILQVKTDHVRYFHVELRRHEIIRAEGLAVESYLETGDRMDFSDDPGATRLFPNFAARLAPNAAWAWETRGVAPMVTAGKELTRDRSGVAANAHCSVLSPEGTAATAG